MAIEFACPCGKLFSVDESKAGKRGRCSACGMELLVPSAVPDLLSRDRGTIAVAGEPDVDGTIPIVEATVDLLPPPLPTATPSHVASIVVEESSKAPPAAVAARPEPWFYAFLTFVGYSYVVLGGAQFALVFLLQLEFYVSTLQRRGGELGGGTIFLFAPTIGSAIIMTTLIFFGGLILLAVDVGRNVRAMRWSSIQ